MRDIKFRAKCKYTNRFIYGDLLHTSSGVRISEEDGDYEILPETIGQYTGLKDINDADIYEGDICRCINCEDEEYLSKIEFDDGAFKIEVTGCDYDYTAIGWALNNDIQEIEIIGNIYENPEILAVEK